jgi:hypothetical protein
MAMMTRARLAALLTVPLMLVAVAGCRDGRGSGSPTAPGTSVDKQFNDIESTLDNIESELNDG